MRVGSHGFTDKRKCELVRLSVFTVSREHYDQGRGSCKNETLSRGTDVLQEHYINMCITIHYLIIIYN